MSDWTVPQTNSWLVHHGFAELAGHGLTGHDLVLAAAGAPTVPLGDMLGSLQSSSGGPSVAELTFVIKSFQDHARMPIAALSHRVSGPSY